MKAWTRYHIKYVSITTQKHDTKRLKPGTNNNANLATFE